MSDKIEDVIFYTLDHTFRTKQKAAQVYFDSLNMDITPEQWVVLKIIDQYSGISQKELADRAAKDTASVTRMLDILEKKGMIVREDDSSDRRKFCIVPTREGKKFIQDHLKYVKDFRKKALKDFSSEDIKQLKSLLEKMQINMN